jgi:hypothetical protein
VTPQSSLELAPLASRLEAVRPLIREALPWSPLDFIRGISIDGDRAMQADSLLRSVGSANDLSFSCRLDSGTEVAVLAERLPWDSAFFGFEVARLNGVFPLDAAGYEPAADYTAAIGALVSKAGAAGIRYLFGAIDGRDLPTNRAVAAAGFVLIETRLTWHQSVRHYHHPRRFRCRRATAADLEALTALAAAVENPYDRFNADPFIPKADVTRLMETWLRASLVEGFADDTFIPDSAAPRAVCTVKYHDDKAAAWDASIAQLVLAMAAPDAGTGFVGIISEIAHHLKERGTDHLYFSTQATNRRIVRVAEHLGFRYGKAEHVFRLLL